MYDIYKFVCTVHIFILNAICPVMLVMGGLRQGQRHLLEEKYNTDHVETDEEKAGCRVCHQDEALGQDLLMSRSVLFFMLVSCPI